jgi:hypothetical protein
MLAEFLFVWNNLVYEFGLDDSRITLGPWWWLKDWGFLEMPQCKQHLYLNYCASKKNVGMKIGIKYTLELKPFPSVLFIKTYYAIESILM